jgi:hypothetical protein
MSDLLARYLRCLSSTGWRLGLSVVLIVTSTLTEGFGLALLLSTLQIVGIEFDGYSGAGYYAARINNLFGASGVRPGLTASTRTMSCAFSRPSSNCKSV